MPAIVAAPFLRVTSAPFAAGRQAGRPYTRKSTRQRFPCPVGATGGRPNAHGHFEDGKDRTAIFKDGKDRTAIFNGLASPATGIAWLSSKRLETSPVAHISKKIEDANVRP
jgi:hypothetical protein